MAPTLSEEIAATAARLVVEEGMEYGPAKRKAAKLLGRHSVRSAEMPGNELVEDDENVGTAPLRRANSTA